MMNQTILLRLVVVCLALGLHDCRWGCSLASAGDVPALTRSKPTRRIAAAQSKNRTIDFRLKPAAALAQVEKSLDELEKIVARAGEVGCDALAFPEDTLGLLKWELANRAALKEVLSRAVSRMLDRLGRAAAKHRLYLVACNDTIEPDGTTHNTAFLLGRDGKEIGRYHKVNLPLAEQGHARGLHFPVFQTPDLGGVGMLICYDMVFPEAPRCLALGGADIIFHPTLGGAAIGESDISLAAFRTRAVENFVYLVVAMRGGGSMIISPQGKVIARAQEADGLAIADIDPAGGREGGDAFNTQRDMRGRLFRERASEAYGILTDPNPPVLAKVRSNVTREEAIRVMTTVLTTGEERFKQAEDLARVGKKDEAIRLYEQLCAECPTSWIERVGRERLLALRPQQPNPKAPVDGALRIHGPKEDKPKVTPIPAAVIEKFNLDTTFYKKHVDYKGFSILGSAKVSDAGLLEACYLIDKLLGDREDILKAMIKRGCRFVVMAPSEMTTDVPEQRYMKNDPKTDWDRRARGLGGKLSSCGEENLVNLKGDRYGQENILVHEFNHAIHEQGLCDVDPTFDGRLRKTYQAAMDKGLWKGMYPATNHKEYWAEGAQAYFDCMRPQFGANTREKLAKYDEGLFKLVDEVYKQSKFRYVRYVQRNLPAPTDDLGKPKAEK